MTDVTLITPRLGRREFARIFADCHPANAAPARVLEKLGLRRQGHVHERASGWDRLYDVMLAPERRGKAV
jgi:RimJ/RimL family protein N-acetyltransferase